MNEDAALARVFPNLTWRELPLEELDLEAAVGNALKRSGIHTLSQLLGLTHPALVQLFPNRKLRCYENVINRLVRLSEETERTDDAGPGFTVEQDISNLFGGGKLSDKKFNIFQVANIWKAEEIHTGVIAELINPGSQFHDMGAVFLDKFLLWIGKPHLSSEKLEDLKHATVETEVPTDKGRRMDMVISTTSFYLPFEVKIWAGDQDRQLADYYDFAQRKAEEQGQTVPGVYYLTPDGHDPSVQSRGGLSDNQIFQLSFEGHILPWLEDCIKVPDIPPDVLEIMKQLHDNIKGQPNTQARPGIQSIPGFSRWNGEKDVLEEIYDKYFSLSWTECTDDYMTFTLHKEGALEFALRVKKEGGGKTRLFLICGVTREDGKPDYASAGDYIAGHEDHFKTLLDRTFQEGDFKAKVKSGKSAWNRLPNIDRYQGLDAGQCCAEIEEILNQLRSQTHSF